MEYRAKVPAFGVRGEIVPERYSVWFPLLLLNVFSIPWGNAVLVAGDFQASRLLTLLLGIVWVFAVTMRDQVNRLRLSHLWMVLFVGWSALSIFFVADTDKAVRRVFSYVELLLLSWIVYQSCRGRRSLFRIIVAFCLGSAVCLGLVVRSYLAGDVWGDGRYTSVGFNPNDIACNIALGVPAACFLLSSQGVRRIYRLLLLSYIPLALVGVYLTASRTALLVFAIVLPYAAASIFPTRWLRLSGVVAIIAAALAAAPLFEGLSLGRLANLGSEIQNRDMNGRVEIWMNALNTFGERNPLTGSGAASLLSDVSQSNGMHVAGHNSLVEVIVEHGVVGLLLFVSINVALFRGASRCPKPIRYFCRILLAQTLLVQMASSWENVEETWLVWGICSVLPATVLIETGETDPAAETR